MNPMISVTDLRRRFKPILDQVVKEKQTLILTRSNRPEAVLIPYDDFIRFQQLRENEVLERFDRLLAKMAKLNASYSEEEVEADLEAADHEYER